MDRFDKIALWSAACLWAMVPIATLRIDVDLRGPNAPAWVQAIGSLLGLVIAIGVPLLINFLEKRSVRIAVWQRTCSLVESLVGAVWLLENEVTRVQIHLARVQAGPPTSDDYFEWFDRAVLSVSPVLVGAVPMMHGLQEDIIGPFRRLTMLAETYNGYVAQFRSRDRELMRTNWAGVIEQLTAQHAVLSRALTKAQTLVNAAV